MGEKYTNLYIGFDVGDIFSQISCYNERREDVESLCMAGRKNAYEIPTKVCMNPDIREWWYGEDAQKAREKGKGILFEHFVQNYDQEQSVSTGGETCEKKLLLKQFIVLSLDIVKLYYPHGRINWLTFTARNLSVKLIRDLKEIGCELGIEPENVRVQSHVASYEYYAMCQERELWQNDVGLFEYSDQGLEYCHLSISRKRTPMVASATALSLKAYLNADDYKQMAPPDLDRRFMEVAREVLNQKLISTIYLTGEGFEQEWMNMSLKFLCGHRRVFVGQNLYAKGACFNSVLEATRTKNQKFIVLNEDVVPENIYLKVSQAKENTRYDLVAAGTSWYNIQESVGFLLDKTDTITLHVRDFITNREKLIPIKLDNMPDRPERTTRVSLNIHFENSEICQVQITDRGFGSLFPGTGKCWKRRLNVVEYEQQEPFIEMGRLILDRNSGDQVPYYFSISGLKVYSVEELCYYMYHNIYAVTKETFGDDLFYWLEKDMGEILLAKGLRNLKRTDPELKELIRFLLSYVDYFTPDENYQLMLIMDDIAKQNPTEARKIEADNYMRYCRYMEAIRTYQNALYDMEHTKEADVTRIFKGDTCHNMGTAYTRLLNFKEAAVCYKKAYECNQKEASLYCYLWALKMSENESEFFDAVTQYEVDEKTLMELMEEYEQTQKKSARENDKLNQVKQLMLNKNSEDYPVKMKKYLDGLKEWYRG